MNVETVVLQRCVTNLLQWVWLDKSSDKLIQSSRHESRSMTTSWYECDNRKVLQKCVTNLLQWVWQVLQWVWLDKLSDKLIQSSHLTIWMPCRWVELRSIEQEKGDMPPLHKKKSGLDRPSFSFERNDQKEECLKLLLRHARLQNMTYSSMLKVGACLYTREEWQG